MLLSMLEGNIVNGTIGKQLLDTLIESQQDVESIIRYFTMFLKLDEVIESEKFKDLDPDGKNIVSKRDFQRQLETSKNYSSEEIDYLMKCIISGKIYFYSAFPIIVAFFFKRHVSNNYGAGKFFEIDQFLKSTNF